MKPGSSPSPRPEACARCGYDLSGTRDAGIEHCPECGWTLADEQRRLDGVQRGLRRIDWAVTAIAALVVLAVVLLTVASARGWI